MAEFGANRPCFQPDSGTGVILGKLVAANLTVNLASGELYADDGLAEQISEFSSGTIAMETDDMTDANASIVYGATVSDGVVTYNKNDTAPRGGLSYYKVLMRQGVKYYKGYYYPRAKATLGNDNAQTRGNAATFQTTSTSFTIFADDSGKWRETKTFNDAASAAAWCETKCGIGTYHEINVSVQGADVGEAVSPVGVAYVADGEDFRLEITGYASVTKAYDNGADVTATITGGNGIYTVAAVKADHTIAIIF